MLPGGLGRFLPCSIGANQCRLRHMGGRRVVMVLLLDLVRVPLSFSWMSFWDSFVILLGLGVHCLLALFLLGIVLLGLLAGPHLAVAGFWSCC